MKRGGGDWRAFGLTAMSEDLSSLSQYISSTGNCQGNLPNEMEQKEFIFVNLSHIEEDAAKGNGEYLKTLFQFFGCEKENHAAVISQLKSDYGWSLGLYESPAQRTHRTFISMVDLCYHYIIPKKER